MTAEMGLKHFLIYAETIFLSSTENEKLCFEDVFYVL